MSAATAALLKNQPGRILVASSSIDFRARLLKSLPPADARSAEAEGGADALIKLEDEEFGTLVLDPQIEDLDVDELVETIRHRFPQVSIVVADPDLDLTQGSLDFASEPEQESIESGSLECETASSSRISDAASVPGLASPATRIEPLPGMIGNSERMQHVYRLARLVAPRDTAVLIVGTTGTGKELIARGIHDLSRRSGGPFVAVNCAAIPESLLEAELFGFTRGAFTGAFQSRLGRIHAAHGGTLFLDEIGELPLSMQSKLLRFVQEGEVQRLGSADLFRVNTRLIVATNADLLQRVREKQFREDFYYRLAVFPVHLPPLCNRSEDILPLARHFLQLLCQQAGTPQKVLTVEAANQLRKHNWPGNVRELQHWIERAFVLSEENQQIRAADLAMPSEIA
jgi:DNA-binding NtrC family response regulator